MRGICCAFVALVAIGCGGDLRSACHPTPPPGSLGSICGFHNPEDLEAVPALGILVVSQMRHAAREEGGTLAVLDLEAIDMAPRLLWPPGSAEGVTDSRRRDTQRADAWGLDADCTQPPKAAAFAPHGITSDTRTSDGSVVLAVVSHGEREAVEFFALTRSGVVTQAAWIGCVRLPTQRMGNDVVLGDDGSIWVTHYHPTGTRLTAAYYAIAVGLGIHTGEVLRKAVAEPWESIPNTESAGPNGLLLSPDGEVVYFSQTGSGLIGVTPVGAREVETWNIAIGGYPDNLTWSPRQTILALTHTDGLAFVLCAFGRTPCRTGWSLFEIETESRRIRQLLHHDGEEVGAVASVATWRGRYYFGAVFDDRIGVWTPSSTPSSSGKGMLQSGQTRLE